MVSAYQVSPKQEWGAWDFLQRVDCCMGAVGDGCYTQCGRKIAEGTGHHSRDI